MTWRLAVLLNRIRKANTMTDTRGFDYAFYPHPKPVALKAAGAHFAGRYVSPSAAADKDGKNLLAPELAALRAAGLEIILYAEWYAMRMNEGFSAGVADASHFDKVTKALGMTGAVMICAADWDVSPAQQINVHGYLDGAASVIGPDRVGIYGGFWAVTRALNAGKAKFAVQTYAWSGYAGFLPPHAEKWEVAGHTYLADVRANVRQSTITVIDGVECDRLNALTADFSQWPRPATAPPPDWEIEIMNRLPLVKYGDNDHITGKRWVRRVQGALIVAYGQDLGPAGGDGVYGPKTRDAVKRVLADHGVASDGMQVDRHGWAVLDTGAHL